MVRRKGTVKKMGKKTVILTDEILGTNHWVLAIAYWTVLEFL